MEQYDIANIILNQDVFFKTQKTKDVGFRKRCLKRLKQEIINQEEAIHNALYADFKKPKFESIISETDLVLSELSYILKNLSSWAQPKNVSPSLLNFPSTDVIYSEPYGRTLIISPWNYPFQLTMIPLIGAIAAGNTVVLKPSELTPNTSKVVEKILSSVFEPEHLSVIHGDAKITQNLLAIKWDYIFFTGSVKVGKIVAKAAAEYLTPTTLELGGKNPCIIHESAPIKLSAKRIVWGKFLNAGQTCIAPDYILIHKSIKDKFVEALKSEINNAYSENQEFSEDIARIINQKNFKRLNNLLKNETILFGGHTNSETLFISPTLIDEPKLNSPVMLDEIFGPILPILSYENDREVDAIISNYEKPLSLYIFSKNKSFTKNILSKHSFGGGAINDTIIHFANHRLPFGGVGHSGNGAYHGKRTFNTFSHQKPIVKKGNWLDIPIRYAPYKGKNKIMKLLLKYF